MNLYPSLEIGLESSYTYQTDLKFTAWSSGDGSSHSNYTEDKKVFHVVYPYLTTTERNQIVTFYDDNKSELFIYTHKDYENTVYSGCVFIKQPEFIYITENRYEAKIEIMEV